MDRDALENGHFLYLHGCIANCAPTNYYQRLKMGEQLYVSGSHSHSLYHHLLQQDLHEADCVFRSLVIQWPILISQRSFSIQTIC